MKKLKSKIESLLFVSGEDGLTKKQLSFLTDTEENQISEALDLLMMEYEDTEDRGIQLKQLAGTYQLVTKEN